jgi:hypothetical protein
VRCTLWRFAQVRTRRSALAAADTQPNNPRLSLAGKNFTEGWVEFEDKRVAKAVAASLNGQQIGGKKRSAYYYDIWNVRCATWRLPPILFPARCCCCCCCCWVPCVRGPLPACNQYSLPAGPCPHA